MMKGDDMKHGLKWLLAWVILVGLVGGVFTTQAQSDRTPIYFLMDGDIWSYWTTTGDLRQESTWGYNEQPILSPDGTRFAYVSLAAIGKQYQDQGGFLVDPIPTNIWIFKVGDTSENNAFRLVDQPANANLNDSEQRNLIRRSSLAWSPDGKQLAWVELNDQYTFQIVVYDFTSNTLRVLSTDVPTQYGDGGRVGIHRMRWGLGGIALDNFTARSDNPSQSPYFEQTISVYDPLSGVLISRTTVGNELQGQSVADFFWLDNGQIALVYQSDQRSILNPTTGAIVPSGTFEVYSRLAPTSSQQRRYSLGSYLANNDHFVWDISWSGGQPVTGKTSRVVDFVAVSPSGNQIAYVDDALYIWNNGSITRVAGTESLGDDYSKGVIWGTVQWRSFGAVTGDPNCPGAPLPHLFVGREGSVISGLGSNVLRDKPGKNADGSREIGNIPPNGVFSVLAGPQCMSGYNWWQVNYNGQVGWTAEGEGAVYWLQPR
jgi:hypothetical protein